jgi:hypothetical protein
VADGSKKHVAKGLLAVLAKFSEWLGTDETGDDDPDGSIEPTGTVEPGGSDDGTGTVSPDTEPTLTPQPDVYPPEES